MNERTSHLGSAEERLWDLLADRALVGLSETELLELEALLAQFPEIDAESLDRTAAALDQALSVTPNVPLPAELAARIAQAAQEHIGVDQDSGRSNRPAPRQDDNVPAYSRLVSWMLVAAALFFAFRVWRTEPQPNTVVPVAVAREDLLRSAKDVVKVDWTATEDPAAKGAAGDLVWSNARQEGYMRFRGLAPNDRTQQQYQLWIFDAAQDERYPIDGGVFDVDPATGDLVVRIQPKLRVARPTLFAVTVEKPGGVVVSSRERLPLLAKVPAG